MGIKSFVKRTASKLLNHESEYSKNVRKVTGDTRSAAQVKKDALKALVRPKVNKKTKSKMGY